MAKYLKLDKQTAINVNTITRVAVEGFEDSLELNVYFQDDGPRFRTVKRFKDFQSAERALDQLLLPLADQTITLGSELGN